MYERWYKGDNWWENMKERIKKKTESQKELDRKLVETIGEDDSYEPIDFEEVKKLVRSGAQIDHWVGEGDAGRFNAVKLAVINKSDSAAEVVGFLVKEFDFIRKDKGNTYSQSRKRYGLAPYPYRTVFSPPCIGTVPVAAV